MNKELYKHIYNDCEMSIFSLNKLLKELKDKDNKIKKVIEDIKKGYHRYFEEVTNILDEEVSENKHLIAKFAASKGISKEVKNDNSDISIIKLLINGISMGIKDMEEKLSNYQDNDKKEEKFARNFLEFQNDVVSGLKKFL